jgi:hypothetical protein
MWLVTPRIFDLEDISDIDLDKVKEGAIFKLVYGYRIGVGYKTKGTELWFEEK